MNSAMGFDTMPALGADGELDQVLTTGRGGQPHGLEIVARGKIGVAVSRYPRSMGAKTADTLIRRMRGEEDQIEGCVHTDLGKLDGNEALGACAPKETPDIDAELAN